MRAQREDTTCMHKSYEREHTHTKKKLLGTGQMLHPVGGAMGVTHVMMTLKGNGYINH